MNNYLPRIVQNTRELVLLIAAMACLFAKAATAAPIYTGPGWVDDIPLGSGSETWQIDWTFALQGPVGSVELVNTSGSMVVERNNGASGDGTIDIEMIALSLSGTSSLGPVTVSDFPFVGNFGQVSQLPGTTLADSFFDIFFELEIGGFPLFTFDPMVFTASGLSGYPPDGTTYTSLSLVGLVDSAANQTGFYVSDADGMTVSFDATVVPLPAAAWLFATGLVGLVGFGRRRKMT